MSAPVDCLIIGGGPAGLTAAIYAARFRMTVLLVDAGDSRAASIPCTRNHAGFPDGIAGAELLSRMRRQALKYGAIVRHARVTDLTSDGRVFVAHLGGEKLEARSVLLATGLTNRRPDIPPELHDAAMAAGRLRYCPVCDGFEVTDRNVAVIGTAEHGVRESGFVRSFTNRVTLIAPGGQHDLTTSQRGSLEAARIAIVEGPAAGFELEGDGLSLDAGGERVKFEAIYPALGSEIHSDLARKLGADLTEEGCIKVDGHQRTSVHGLYAAGDVVLGLDQISHAMGEAGVAVTTLRNDLAEIRPFRR